MACDHALAELAGRGGPPVLRFYAWDPPALSLGHNQTARPLRDRIEALRAAGFGAVRRPTGGGAVLHAREVTYAVVLPPGHAALAGGPRAACARVHAAILAGLEGLGVRDLALHGLHGAPAPSRRLAPTACGGPGGAAPPSPALIPRSAGAASGPGAGPAICFAAPSRSEIAWRGRKLVGSAQRRLAGAVLQHGSILLQGDQSELERLWPGGSAAGSLAGLNEAAGREVAPDEVARAVERGFARELGAAPEEGPLEREELRRVESLIEECYGREDFLYRS